MEVATTFYLLEKIVVEKVYLQVGNNEHRIGTIPIMLRYSLIFYIWTVDTTGFCSDIYVFIVTLSRRQSS